jgi:hypothetical protein
LSTKLDLGVEAHKQGFMKLLFFYLWQGSWKKSGCGYKGCSFFAGGHTTHSLLYTTHPQVGCTQTTVIVLQSALLTCSFFLMFAGINTEVQG